MIAVDTSALMAVALGEPQAAACRDVLAAETTVIMSAATFAEALIVSARRNVDDEMNRIVDGLCIEVVPVTAASARRTAVAYRRYGKGFHPTGLNYGNCFAYEVAQAHDCPLLFVGDNFARTDLRRAL